MSHLHTRVEKRSAPDRATFTAGFVPQAAARLADACAATVASPRVRDLALARACAQGDERAWEEFGRTHFGFIRSFARRFLEPLEADDLAGQVIADLWERESLARYDGRATLRTWLGAVVTHAALNALHRARCRASRRAGPEPDTAEPDSTDSESSELLARFTREALAALPAEDKLLVRLYYEERLTLDELAVVSRVSKATSSRRLKRACRGLHAAIDSAARQAVGAPAELLRRGVDLSRLEFDLPEALAGGH